jgi:hypothetical protein
MFVVATQNRQLYGQDAISQTFETEEAAREWLRQPPKGQRVKRRYLDVAVDAGDWWRWKKIRLEQKT